MRILIIGAGAVGANLAQQLANEKHDVSIIDSREEVVKVLSNRLDAMVIHGNGASPQTLERAGIRSAELVISVTDKDELNMIVSLLARNYGVSRRIARIRNPEYSGPNAVLNRQQLAIDRIINPEEIAVDHMVELISIAGATDVATFAEHKVRMVGFLVPAEAPIAGRRLQEFRQISPGEFLVVAIHRGKEVIIPKGTDTIQPNDRIFVLMPTDLLKLFLGCLFKRVHKVRKVVIYGASRMGISLAQRLAETIPDVTLLDGNRDACREAAALLDKVTVMQGSALDPDMLREVRIENAQVFCAVSDDDASNVMSALLAKDHGTERAIVSQGEPDFVPIVKRIGLDSAINPRLLAVDAILRFVRSGNVLSVVHLAELKAEVVEMVPVATSAVVNKPLAESASLLPPGVLIGTIIRDNQMIIPSGRLRSKVRAW